VMPALAQFISRFPEIELHLAEDDRFVDLVREGVDCVLRAGTLQDSSMIGRRLARLEQVTVASPAYLDAYGEPHSLDELRAHRAVNFVSSASGSPMPFEFTVDARVTEVAIGGIVAVTSADLYTGAALSGLGLVQVPRYRIADELARGQLKIVLEHYAPPPMPVTVLYPQNRQLSSRVRAFADWLREVFETAAPSAAGPTTAATGKK
jgi:DNA-binding transcriptional LysR family regulator